jgi:hypothetical protein
LDILSSGKGRGTHRNFFGTRGIYCFAGQLCNVLNSYDRKRIFEGEGERERDGWDSSRCGESLSDDNFLLFSPRLQECKEQKRKEKRPQTQRTPSTLSLLYALFLIELSLFADSLRRHTPSVRPCPAPSLKQREAFPTGSRQLSDPDLDQSAGGSLQAPLCPPPRPVPKVVERIKEITKERQKKPAPRLPTPLPQRP